MKGRYGSDPFAGNFRTPAQELGRQEWFNTRVQSFRNKALYGTEGCCKTCKPAHRKYHLIEGGKCLCESMRCTYCNWYNDATKRCTHD